MSSEFTISFTGKAETEPEEDGFRFRIPKKRGKDVPEPKLKDVLAFTQSILHQIFPFVNTLHKKLFL